MDDITDVLKKNPSVYLKKKIGDHKVKVMFWNVDSWIVVKKWHQCIPQRICCNDNLKVALKKFLE